MPYCVYSIVLISFLFSFLLPFLAQSSRSGPLTRVLSAGLASAQFLGLSRGDKHLRLSRKLHDVRHYMAHDAPTHLHFPRTFFAAKHTPNKCVRGARIFFSFTAYLGRLQVSLQLLLALLPGEFRDGTGPSPAARGPCASCSDHPSGQRLPALDPPCPPAAQRSPWSPPNCQGITVFVSESP